MFMFKRRAMTPSRSASTSCQRIVLPLSGGGEGWRLIRLPLEGGGCERRFGASGWGSLAAIVVVFAATTASAADSPKFGKPISEADVTTWDISIAPDGKGLPAGSGTPAQRKAIFAQKCAACHGA